MKPIEQERTLRQKVYQNEIEKRRSARNAEIEQQREKAIVNFRKELERQKPQIEALIIERLLTDKFALVTSTDLQDLQIILKPEIEPRAKAYQMISDFYDEIANESGLVRVKLEPDSFNTDFYLTYKQQVEYKSESLDAVFGIDKDYQVAREKIVGAHIVRLAISLVCTVIITLIFDSTFLTSEKSVTVRVLSDLSVGFCSFIVCCLVFYNSDI
ncbi:5-oxoprolinase [Weissella oryzae SG25]|uniref:5-oxoprolinase n=1 Tax=Weissella oryzae (strain DSM 25784 / JCM 18191 / LMG 30913 / SG25) TaxID=1329250 RepID=A0A069CW42_WEIOS|nr:hypothetical protein [Weissella oryzae]GAK31607.1 5-oxoprolinase [Weissella oryzae SG25]